MKLTEKAKAYLEGKKIIRVTDCSIILSDGVAIYLDAEEIETINEATDYEE